MSLIERIAFATGAALAGAAGLGLPTILRRLAVAHGRRTRSWNAAHPAPLTALERASLASEGRRARNRPSKALSGAVERLAPLETHTEVSAFTDAPPRTGAA